MAESTLLPKIVAAGRSAVQYGKRAFQHGRDTLGAGVLRARRKLKTGEFPAIVGGRGNIYERTIRIVDKPLKELMEFIDFIRELQRKINSSFVVAIKEDKAFNRAEVFSIIIKGLANSKKYEGSILLLSEDGQKLRLWGTSLAEEQTKTLEKPAQATIEEFVVPLQQARIYRRAIEGNIVLYEKTNDILQELFPAAVARKISGALDYSKKFSIVAPIKQNGKAIGILVLSGFDLPERFMSTAENFAEHVSIALDLAEAGRRKALAEAFAENRARWAAMGEGAGSLAHDLNNMMVIFGILEMLNTEFNRFVEHMQGCFDEESKAAEILEGIREILSDLNQASDKIKRVVARFFDRGIVGLTDNDFFPEEVIQDETILFGRSFQRKEIELIYESGKSNPVLFGKEAKFSEIISNLLTNALEATLRGGRVKIVLKVHEGKVWVKVADNGRGISSEDQKSIFDAFYTTKPKGKGSGVGLYMVKQEVESMGGEISVESTPGKGTTFTLCFPCKSEEG